MFETLLRRLTHHRMAPRPIRLARLARSSASVAGGLRLLRYVAREHEEVLYRTRVVAGRSVRDHHESPAQAVDPRLAPVP